VTDWKSQSWWTDYDKPDDIRKFKTPVAKFLRLHLDLPKAANVVGAVWNEMALAQLGTPESVEIAIHNKARQRGWSFNEAAIAVARSIIVPRSNTLFISYNETESKGKIRYCHDIINALRPQVRLELVKENETEIKFDNGSRIESLPCKEPRGMAQPYIVLDEFAMYNEHSKKGADKTILTAARGALGQAGCIRIGSTPKPVCYFRELVDPAFRDDVARVPDDFDPPPVHEWPWWSFGDLCRDRVSAGLNADAMPTEERVERFGTKKLKKKFAEAVYLGDVAGFQQEFECAWIAEAAQLIPEYLVTDAVADYEYPSKPPVMGITAIGADFGRRQDMTAYVVVHSENGKMRVLDIQRLKGEGVQEQADALSILIQRYQPFVVPMDVTDGFGQACLDLLHPKHPVVKPITFSSRQLKEEMMSAVVGAFVNHAIELPKDDGMIARDTASVRKVHTAGGAVKFEAPRDSKGHADSFFSLAMAINELPRASAGTFEYKSAESRAHGWGNAAPPSRGHFDNRGPTTGQDEGSSRWGGGSSKWDW